MQDREPLTGKGAKRIFGLLPSRESGGISAGTLAACAPQSDRRSEIRSQKDINAEIEVRLRETRALPMS
jgi:hypothetical protein